MNKITAIATICLASATCASCQDNRTVSVTVVGDDGAPVSEAEVGVAFLGYSGDEDKIVKGATDAEGRYSASGLAPLRIGVTIKKEGYHKSQIPRLSRKEDHDLEVVLRQKKKPISLFARKFRGKIPGIGNDYGFDLKMGDWVAPEGEGKQSDFYFRAEIIKDANDEFSGRMTISFQNEHEGIATVNQDNGYLSYSELTMPNDAFENGYAAEFQRIEKGYQNENKPRNTSYFLRTRIQKIEEGKHLFNYSKIGSGIEFRMGGGRFIEEPYRSKNPQEYGAVTFTYYFNPEPNDRNLEFDPKKNLFDSLDTSERVREP